MAKKVVAPEAGYHVRAIADVDLAFAEWAKLETESRNHVTKADEKIDAIRSALKKLVDPISARIKLIKEVLSTFAKKHKSKIVSGDIKSKDFAQGRIKFIEQREQVFSADKRELPVVLRELLDELKLKETVRELLDKRVQILVGEGRSIAAGELLDVNFDFSLTRIKAAVNEKKLITAEELALIGLKIDRAPENIQITLRDAS